MRAILPLKTNTWKVTQWGGQHTCLNPTLAQDHSKLTLDTIANNIKGKALVDSKPFDLKITNIERKNRKKKKQATAKTPEERSNGAPPLLRVLGEKNYFLLDNVVTIHARISGIDDKFGWNMLHVRDVKGKLQKRKINTLVEDANS
ncbi:hypothetical protein JHK87_050309 [Glycine soja]|nr:hypothetical protein JHK87_050309 [Glycine soja]